MAKRKWLLGGVLVIAGLSWALAGQQAAQAEDSAISEVSILHTGCFGTCPVYQLTLRRDGTAVFIGSNHVSKVGTYQASYGRFERLAQAIQQHGFQQFKSRYSSLATDLSHTVTTVVRGKGRKTVDNYGDPGPQSLWEIQTLIDGAVAEAHWKKVSSSTDFH